MTETNCSDGVNEDMDANTDCADTDCAMAPACSTIVINEINYDNVGNPDTAEFVELYNPGPNPTNLDGVALLLVNGNTNPVPTVYSPSTDLSGFVLPAGGYLVVGPSTLMIAAGAQKVDFATSSDVLQNGGANISAAGDAVVLFDNNEKILLDALSYEAPVLNATISGASYDLYEGPMPFPALLPGETSLAPEASVIRFPNGVDTGNDNVDVRTTSLLTPGAANLAAEICNDMTDNDGDMAVDCADTDCSAAANCMEICTDGVDNNANMLVDCAEMSCNAMACGPNGLTCASNVCGCPTGNMENCVDGMDNDCDGLNNCADPDCSLSPACSEICNDGVDNNGNSLVDCAEGLCDGQVCGTNGKTCISSMCSCAGGSTETACGDVADNDCDGMVDCMDSDCTGMPACMMPVGGLIISEYVEGSGTRKAIEITNRSNTPYDLVAHGCVLHRYSNGSATSSATFTFTAKTLAPMTGTYVVCNPSGVNNGPPTPGDAGGIPIAQCDTTNSAINHNGDDSYDLTCDGVIVDFIGQIGVPAGMNYALDVTLLRKCSATAHTMTSNMFAAAEWAVLPVNTFTGLGDSTCAP